MLYAEKPQDHDDIPIHLKDLLSVGAGKTFSGLSPGLRRRFLHQSCAEVQDYEMTTCSEFLRLVDRPAKLLAIQPVAKSFLGEG